MNTDMLLAAINYCQTKNKNIGRICNLTNVSRKDVAKLELISNKLTELKNTIENADLDEKMVKELLTIYNGLVIITTEAERKLYDSCLIDASSIKDIITSEIADYFEKYKEYSWAKQFYSKNRNKLEFRIESTIDLAANGSDIPSTAEEEEFLNFVKDYILNNYKGIVNVFTNSEKEERIAENYISRSSSIIGDVINVLKGNDINKENQVIYKTAMQIVPVDHEVKSTDIPTVSEDKSIIPFVQIVPVDDVKTDEKPKKQPKEIVPVEDEEEEDKGKAIVPRRKVEKVTHTDEDKKNYDEANKKLKILASILGISLALLIAILAVKYAKDQKNKKINNNNESSIEDLSTEDIIKAEQEELERILAEQNSEKTAETTAETTADDKAEDKTSENTQQATEPAKQTTEPAKQTTEPASQVTEQQPASQVTEQQPASQVTEQQPEPVQTVVPDIVRNINIDVNNNNQLNEYATQIQNDLNTKGIQVSLNDIVDAIRLANVDYLQEQPFGSREQVSNATITIGKIISNLGINAVTVKGQNQYISENQLANIFNKHGVALNENQFHFTKDANGYHLYDVINGLTKEIKSNKYTAEDALKIQRVFCELVADLTIFYSITPDAPISTYYNTMGAFIANTKECNVQLYDTPVYGEYDPNTGEYPVCYYAIYQYVMPNCLADGLGNDNNAFYRDYADLMINPNLSRGN